MTSWAVESWAKRRGLVQRFGGRTDPLRPGVVTLRQVHGSRVVVVANDRRLDTDGDGLLTDRAGIVVGVWTADCVPIHLLATDAPVVGSVHSGWRGTVAGVFDAAADELHSRWNVAPASLEVALGPAIGGCCYQVGEEVRAAFRARYGQAGEIGFLRRGGSLFLDLRTFLAAHLREIGVGRVEQIGPCTACRSDVLFSFRKEGKTGRQLSYIGWRA